MKKFLVLLIILSLLFVSNAWAAGTCTQVFTQPNRSGLRTWILTCTSATTTWDAVASDRDIEGLIIVVATNPGTTGPTDDYDITITNADDIDVMGGSLGDRDISVSEWTQPKLNGNYGAVPTVGPLTVNITNNSVTSAVVVITVYFLE